MTKQPASGVETTGADETALHDELRVLRREYRDFKQSILDALGVKRPFAVAAYSPAGIASRVRSLASRFSSASVPEARAKEKWEKWRTIALRKKRRLAMVMRELRRMQTVDEDGLYARCTFKDVEDARPCDCECPKDCPEFPATSVPEEATTDSGLLDALDAKRVAIDTVSRPHLYVWQVQSFDHDNVRDAIRAAPSPSDSRPTQHECTGLGSAGRHSYAPEGDCRFCGEPRPTQEPKGKALADYGPGSAGAHPND